MQAVTQHTALAGTGAMRFLSNKIRKNPTNFEPSRAEGPRLAPHYLQLLVEAVELSYSRLVVMVTINPAVLQHLQLPGELLHFGHGQHQLALLLLEQAVHLFNLLHCKEGQSTIAALRNSPAWAASKAALKEAEQGCSAKATALSHQLFL